MSVAALDLLLLGQDLAIPDDASADAKITPAGDLALASGREAVRGGLRRRMMASPGDLLHRPDYGVGLIDFVETASTPARRAELANRARRNLLADPRVAEARVAVSVGVPGDTSRVEALTLEVSAKLRQSLGDEQITISYAG